MLSCQHQSAVLRSGAGGAGPGWDLQLGWRADLDRVCGIHGERSQQSEDGQAAQMRWTQRGAHLLLQVRTQVLNEDLRDTFCRWYPGMATTFAEELPLAA